jgi:hypothetical protein
VTRRHIRCYLQRVRLADQLKLLFWDVDFETLEVARDVDFILPRVLEFGRLEDIAWLVESYGFDRIHEFLRDCGHAELSARTVTFWRNFFDAREEPWASPPAWRRNSSAPWVG